MSRTPRSRGRRQFCREHLRAPTQCAPGSFRTVVSRAARVLVCCPRGAWNPGTRQCRIGTRAVTVLRPRHHPKCMATEGRDWKAPDYPLEGTMEPGRARINLPLVAGLAAGAGLLALLARGRGGGPGGGGGAGPAAAVQQGLAAAREQWQVWQKLSKDERRRQVLRFVNEGIGDQRKALADYENLWCGAFAAWALRAVHPAIRLASFASTLRLMDLGRYGTSFNPYRSVVVEGGKRVAVKDYHAKHGGARLYQEPAKTKQWSWAPQPGDIALVGQAKKNPAVPAHVTVVHDFDPATGTIRAINGNGGGLDPAGKQAAGVVMTTFPPEKVQVLVRLAPADFDPGVKFSKEPPNAAA